MKTTTLHQSNDAARDAGQDETANTGAKLPNYRVYDRTGGGGGRADIYAETLEEAVAQGREWIEDGHE